MLEELREKISLSERLDIRTGREANLLQFVGYVLAIMIHSKLENNRLKKIMGKLAYLKNEEKLLRCSQEDKSLIEQCQSEIIDYALSLGIDFPKLFVAHKVYLDGKQLDTISEDELLKYYDPSFSLNEYVEFKIGTCSRVVKIILDRSKPIFFSLQGKIKQCRQILQASKDIFDQNKSQEVENVLAALEEVLKKDKKFITMSPKRNEYKRKLIKQLNTFLISFAGIPLIDLRYKINNITLL